MLVGAAVDGSATALQKEYFAVDSAISRPANLVGTMLDVVLRRNGPQSDAAVNNCHHGGGQLLQKLIESGPSLHVKVSTWTN